MPLSQADVDLIKQEIVGMADMAALTAGVIDPAVIPLIAIGKGIAVLSPQLVKDVEDWLAKKDPTDADNATIAQKIGALASPENL